MKCSVGVVKTNWVNMEEITNRSISISRSRAEEMSDGIEYLKKWLVNDEWRIE